MSSLLPVVGALFASVACASLEGDPPAPRERARDLGMRFGEIPTGKHNAITDVEGVAIGHATLLEGESVRTGVTVIVPRLGENSFLRKLPAAVSTGNGFGKAAGFTQVQELGTLESPVALSNTLAVGTVLESMVRLNLVLPGNEKVRSINVVVGETNDGWLSAIRALPVRFEHVEAAWKAAARGPVAEGCVGAGTGTRCLGYKGGIGTASRVLEGLGTIGVLVQTNYGGRLRYGGEPLPRFSAAEKDREEEAQDGSCWIVVATDAPLDARQLGRIARRTFLGLARTGSVLSHGSGDYALAFSTYETNLELAGSRELRTVTLLPDATLTPFFEAVVDATEEAVWNSLVAAKTTFGRDGHRSEALDRAALRRYLAGR